MFPKAFLPILFFLSIAPAMAQDSPASDKSPNKFRLGNPFKAIASRISSDEKSKERPKTKPAAQEKKEVKRLGEWFAGRRTLTDEREKKIAAQKAKAKQESLVQKGTPKATEAKPTKSIGKWFASRREAKPQQSKKVVAKNFANDDDRGVGAAADSSGRPKLSLPSFLKRSADPSKKKQPGNFFLVRHTTPLYLGNPGMPPFSMSYKGGVEEGEIVEADSANQPFTSIRRLHDGKVGFVNSIALKRATNSQFLTWQGKIEDGYRPSSYYKGGESLIARNSRSSSPSSTTSRRRRSVPGATDEVFRPVTPPNGYEEPTLPSEETTQRRPLSSILFGGGTAE